MGIVADHGVSVVMSSHLLADLERACDSLVVLAGSHVQVAGEIDDLLATHHRLIGPRRDGQRTPSDWEIVEATTTERQSTLVVRHTAPVLDPAWSVEDVDLEDLVLAYMGRAAGSDRRRPLAGVAS